jgi:hypothetical protein
MDSTHYAQCGLDPRLAAETLRPRPRTVHLSDYDSEGGRAHLFPGRGELDLGGFLARLDLGRLHALTIECGVPYDAADPDDLGRQNQVVREYVAGAGYRARRGPTISPRSPISEGSLVEAGFWVASPANASRIGSDVLAGESL